MIKLVLCLIIAANCHLINVEERVSRAAEPVVSFNKLTAEENEERLEKCGRLKWPVDASVSMKWQALVNFPWILKVFKKGEELYSDSLVVISKRHMLADGHSIRKWDLTSIFGDFSHIPAQVLSAPIENSPSIVSVFYCIGNFSGTCPYSRFDRSPTKIIIDNSKDPRLVLFEFDQDIPIDPICLPEKELVKGEEVLIQHREKSGDRMRTYNLSDIHQNGWAVHKTSDPKRSYSQVLVKKENGRFTIAGNWDHYTKTANSSYLLFSSVFPYTDKICQWTGVCSSPPHVGLKRISVEENKERLRKCGRLKHPATDPSSDFSIARDSPWIVSIERSDGHSHTGVLISQRHILVDWYLFEGLDWNATIRNYEEKRKSTISTRLPLIHNSVPVLNFKVTLSTCEDDKCEMKKEETLKPEKIHIVPNLYAVLEIGQDIQVPPICVFNYWLTERRDQVIGVSANGSRTFYDLTENDNEVSILMSSNGPKDMFSETLVQKQQNVFTVVGFQKTYLNKTNEIRFRAWKEQLESVCEATGVCQRSMVPLQLKQNESQKLTTDEDDRRRDTCGILSSATTHSRRFVGARDAPWLVGIRPSRISPIHTGVIISRRHVLFDGIWLGESEQLSEFFGNFFDRQAQMMSVALPEYDFSRAAYNFDVLIRVCNGTQCTSQTEIVKKPSKLLLHDSSDPSVLIFEFNEDLPNVPICLEDRKEVEEDDEIFVQHYTDSPNRVLKVDQKYILAAMAFPPRETSKVLVRKDGTRTVLMGNWPLLNDSSPSRFASVFSNRYKICDLTGVCPPLVFHSEIKKLTRQEDQERLQSCGLLNRPMKQESDYPKEPVIARDAPWLVGFQGPDTQIHTGVVISKRHVLIDRSLVCRELKKDEKCLEPSEDYRIALPMSRTNFLFRVKLRVCKDTLCNEDVEIERIPTKYIIAVNSKNDKYATILEFDEELPVTPICIPASEAKKDEEVFVQDYTNPKTMLNREVGTVRVLLSEDRRLLQKIHLTGPRLHVGSNTWYDDRKYSHVLTRNVNGRFTIIGNLKRSGFQCGRPCSTQCFQFFSTTG